MRTPRLIGCFAVFAIALVSASQLIAQPIGDVSKSPPHDQDVVRRVRGIIDHDERWTGRVLITDETTILGATVTIEAGAIVEFAVADQARRPVLNVEPRDDRAGRLEFEATADLPATIRTRDGALPGWIVVRVARSAPGERLPGLAWRHVRFIGLGGVRDFDLKTPAIRIDCDGETGGVRLTDCIFEDCGPVEIDAGADANVLFADNRTHQTREGFALRMAGGDSPPGNDRPGAGRRIEIRGNRLDAAVNVAAGPAEIRGNLMIGKRVGLYVDRGLVREVRITGNFVRNTSPPMAASTCLDIGSGAIVEGNILRGGQACVANGPRVMRGNVIIGGADAVGLPAPGRQTRELVGALPSGAIFERNILIGPATTMMLPQPRADRGDGGPVRIVHNVFDGGRSNERALVFEDSRASDVQIIIENNLFLRTPRLLVDLGARSRLVRAGSNAAAPTPQRLFEDLRPRGRSEADDPARRPLALICPVDELRLTKPDGPDIDGIERELIAGKITVAAAIERIRAAYAPLPGSPLIGAGHSQTPPDSPPARSPSIGAIEPIRSPR